VRGGVEHGRGVADARQSASQAPGAAAPGTIAGDSAQERLPVKRVVLYKNGVGFFEHLGRVRGTQQVTVDFTSGQLNDVLKSLTTVDLGNGKVTGISFNTDDPASRKLGSLALPLEENATALAFLGAIRGARVDVRSAGQTFTGRVLAVEQRTFGEQDRQTAQREFSIVTDGGELRTFDVSPNLAVRVLDGELGGDIRRYLDIVAATRQRDLRRMTIATAGTGDRQMYVSYISEVPIWKSTYRLVLPSRPGDKPLLQGWAIVDNTIGEDWANVELSLVAGSPQSFIQHLSQPLYARRPVMPLPVAAQLTPQTYEGTLSDAAPVESPKAFGRGAGAAGAASAPAYAMAPPPPSPAPGMLAGEARIPERRASTESAAYGREMGDLFEYRLKEPVTIRKNQSALVPIINAQVEAERVSVWTASTGARPRSVVWLTNTTAFTLDGGAYSVLESATFTGEGLMDVVKPGERRLLSYASDLSLLVDARSESAGPARLASLRISRGVMVTMQELRDTWSYTIRNEDTRSRTVIVEHPNRAGWTLVGGPRPEETTLSAYRFRVVAGPKATMALTVEESQVLSTSYQVANLTPEQVAVFARQRTLTPEIEQALRAIVAKKSEVAAVAAEIADRHRETERIFRDQERVRENLKALKGSAEEKSLVARYTRQLDEQESRLEAIKREVAEREARRAKLQTELDSLIDGVSIGS
jgi:hypothetical protein